MSNSINIKTNQKILINNEESEIKQNGNESLTQRNPLSTVWRNYVGKIPILKRNRTPNSSTLKVRKNSNLDKENSIKIKSKEKKEISENDIFRSDRKNEIFDKVTIDKKGAQTISLSIKNGEQSKDDDEIFLWDNGENQKEQFSGIISPIEPNPFTEINRLLPKDKFMVMHKIKTTIKKKNKYDDDGTDIEKFCISDYLEDVIDYLMTYDNIYVQKENFLETYNPCIKNRYEIINWLLKIQHEIRLTTSQLIMVTYFFDYILANFVVPINMYQIVLVITAWLVLKLESPCTIRAEHLQKICQNTYTLEQFYKMEIKILKMFDFKFYVRDPFTFANYYTKRLDLKYKIFYMHSINYILETFTLNAKFSTFPISKLVSSALYLILKIMKKDRKYNSLSGMKYYHDPLSLSKIIELMEKQIEDINKNWNLNCIYKKFSSSEYLKCSFKLKQIMQNDCF